MTPEEIRQMFEQFNDSCVALLKACLDRLSVAERQEYVQLRRQGWEPFDALAQLDEETPGAEG